jgi:hypothetical protein
MSRAKRIAENEAVFRDLNKRKAEWLRGGLQAAGFRCECWRISFSVSLATAGSVHARLRAPIRANYGSEIELRILRDATHTIGSARMNRIWRISLLTALLGVVCAPPASASTFTNTTPIKVPAQGQGPGAATPYPSTITVTGIPGFLAKVRVTLTGFSYEHSNDVDVLLVAPDDSKAILMSDTCGAGVVTNLTFTFDDAASPVLDFPCVSGSYKPTDNVGNENVVFPAPAPAGPYPVGLSVPFVSSGNGHHLMNGPWRLFVQDDADDASGAVNDTGSFSGGWALELLPSLKCDGKPATLARNVGLDGPDNLIGTAGPDVMIGLGGDDNLSGLGQNDALCGGFGKDLVMGGLKKDVLKGAHGNDTLKGGKGPDMLFGEAGNDTLIGGPGTDICIGGGGRDIIRECQWKKGGVFGGDICTGRAGKDIFLKCDETDRPTKPKKTEKPKRPPQR